MKAKVYPKHAQRAEGKNHVSITSTERSRLWKALNAQLQQHAIDHPIDPIAEQVLQAVFRQTIGFGKREEDLSGRRLYNLTAYSSDECLEQACELVEQSILIERDGFYGHILSINYRFEQWGQDPENLEPLYSDPEALLQTLAQSKSSQMPSEQAENIPENNEQAENTPENDEKTESQDTAQKQSQQPNKPVETVESIPDTDNIQTKTTADNPQTEALSESHQTITTTDNPQTEIAADSQQTHRLLETIALLSKELTDLKKRVEHYFSQTPEPIATSPETNTNNIEQQAEKPKESPQTTLEEISTQPVKPEPLNIHTATALANNKTDHSNESNPQNEHSTNAQQNGEFSFPPALKPQEKQTLAALIKTEDIQDKNIIQQLLDTLSARFKNSQLEPLRSPVAYFKSLLKRLKAGEFIACTTQSQNTIPTEISAKSQNSALANQAQEEHTKRNQAANYFRQAALVASSMTSDYTLREWAQKMKWDKAIEEAGLDLDADPAKILNCRALFTEFAC